MPVFIRTVNPFQSVLVCISLYLFIYFYLYFYSSRIFVSPASLFSEKNLFRFFRFYYYPPLCRAIAAAPPSKSHCSIVFNLFPRIVPKASYFVSLPTNPVAVSKLGARGDKTLSWNVFLSIKVGYKSRQIGRLSNPNCCCFCLLFILRQIH